MSNLGKTWVLLSALVLALPLACSDKGGKSGPRRYHDTGFRDRYADDEGYYEDEDVEGKVVREDEDDVEAGGRCELHATGDRKWEPGLPTEPSAKVICTGYAQGRVGDGLASCDPREGALFTDSRQDRLMAIAVERFDKTPDAIRAAGLRFAKSIREIKVHTDLEIGRVRVRIRFSTGGEERTYTLKGELEDAGAGRADIRLRSGRDGGPYFTGMLTCADLDDGCQSSLLRLEGRNQGGKLKAVAYAVHRWGGARVTLSRQDRLGSGRYTDRAQREFTAFLSRAVGRSCDGRDGAATLDFRSWSVAYGGAFFELGIYDAANGRTGLFDYDVTGAPLFRVQGPLMIRARAPMLKDPLIVDGSLAEYVDRAILRGNDGGGNLNIELNFAGGGDDARGARTRFNVSTYLNKTAGQVEESARQMPDVDAEVDK